MTTEKTLSPEQTEAKQQLIAQGYEVNAIDAYIALGDYPLDTFEEAYQGHFDSDEEFAKNMAEQTGAMPSDSEWPNYCIDWEFAARELMYDYNEENGYYFRSL